jgi:siroheme synthase
VTIVSNATLRQQTVMQTTLGRVDDFLTTTDPPTPAIVVIGRIADWRPLLDWYKDGLRDNPIG